MPAFAGEGRYFVMVPEGSIDDPEMPGMSTSLILEAMQGNPVVYICIR